MLVSAHNNVLNLDLWVYLIFFLMLSIGWKLGVLQGLLLTSKAQYLKQLLALLGDQMGLRRIF